MKIFSPEQIRRWDKQTVDEEGTTSFLLMERAAHACMVWICNHYRIGINFHIFCGHGNNGGDGLAIARLLHRKGYQVNV